MRKKLLVVFGFLLLVLTGGGSVFWTSPLWVDDVKARWDFESAGWHTFESKTLTGYEKDGCDKAEDCTCVALVHGFCDSATTWRIQMLDSRPPWGKKALLVVPELPGSGKTLKNPELLGVRELAREVNRVLETRCSRWVVVGNSLGGWVTLAMGLEKPELFRHLVVLSPAGVSPETEQAFGKFENPSRESIAEFMKLTSHQQKEYPDFIWDDVVESFRACTSLGAEEKAIQRDLQEIDLSKLKVPTRIVWGKADRLIAVTAGKKMEKLIPVSQLRELPDCGHLPQRECPALVKQQIEDVLKLKEKMIPKS